MSRKALTLDEFQEYYQATHQGVNHAIVNFTGNHSKHVSVENIVNNNLFLFKFEETYVHDYLKAYNYYTKNNYFDILPFLKT